MIIKNNYNLKNNNTFHLGAIAKNFYIPENEEELISLIRNIKEEKFYILSGGSNVLINDEKVYEHIIFMNQVNTDMINLENGKFYIGASNRIQKVINFVNECGYGGIEELYGLPAMFGGIVYMNAGIGSRKKELFSISEYVDKVKVLYIPTCEIKYLDKTECCFGYRQSIFQNNDYIILGAEITLYEQDKLKSRTRIDNRLKHCKENQEWGKGCFGTCFSTASKKILKIIQIFNVDNKKKGIVQSKKNPNWLMNTGNASFAETMKFIKKCFFWHKFFKKDIECEVRIWD